MSNRPKNEGKASAEGADFAFQEQEQDQKKPLTEADHLYIILKPLHNLPRGKNTWDPKFIKIWWFWPASAAVLIVLYHVYPLLWDFVFGP